MNIYSVENNIPLQQPVELNYSDITVIEKLLLMRDVCTACKKPLITDPMRRRVRLRLTDHNSASDPQLIGHEICLVTCNACGVYWRIHKMQI